MHELIRGEGHGKENESKLNREMMYGMKEASKNIKTHQIHLNKIIVTMIIYSIHYKQCYEYGGISHNGLQICEAIIDITEGSNSYPTYIPHTDFLRDDD